MVIGFVAAVWLVYRDSSSVRIQRVYLDKHPDYAIQRLHNTTAAFGSAIDTSNSSTSSEILNCPCTNTVISWTAYTHFYTLTYTPPGDPPLGYIIDPVTGDLTAVVENPTNPPNASQVDPRYLLKVDDLTREDFCTNVSILPTKFTLSAYSALVDCWGLVTSFFTTLPLPETNGNARPRWNNPQASTFDTSLLLKQELLYSNTLQRLYAYIQDQYARLSSMRPYLRSDDETYRDMLLLGISELWLNVLDTFTRNSSASDADFWWDSSETLTLLFYDQQIGYPENESAWTVTLDAGQTYLGMDINWMDYYKACNPSYCDVTKSSTTVWRLYVALAQIGGLMTIVSLLFKLAVFPLVLQLLVKPLGKCLSESPRTPSAHANGRIELVRSSVSSS